MEVVMAAKRVNTNSGDKIKMTENATMDEALEKIGSFGFDSRDRRKSKYLSYPYTNMGPRHKDLQAETEDLTTPCLSHKAETSSTATNALNRTPKVAKLRSKRCPSHKAETSSTIKNALNRTPSIAKLGSKRFRRNWYRKFISCSAIPSSSDFINASPAELLSGLYLTAVDCMFPMEDKNYDLVEWFFCRYRVSEYHDEAELATSQVNVKGGNMGKPVGNDLQDIKTEKRRKYNKKENTIRRKMKSLSGLSDVNRSDSTSDCLMPGEKLKQKMKVEEVTPLQQSQNVETTLNESNGKRSSVPEVPQISTGDSLRAGVKLKQKRKVEEVTPLQQQQNVDTSLNASNCKHSSVPEVPQISTSDSLGPGGKLKQKRKVEEVSPLQRSQNVEITLNASNCIHSSVPEVPQISTSDPLKPGGKLKQKRKVEEVSPLQRPQNVEITLNASNCKHSSVPEVPQSLTCFASEKSGPKRRKKVELAPEYQSAENASVNSDTKITKCSSLVIDLQLTSPSIPGPILQKSNGENKEELVLIGSNPESCVSQEGLVGNFTDHGLWSSTTSAVDAVLVNETGLKGKMEKVAEGYLSNKLAAEIPDLNCTVCESNSISREYENVHMLSPEVKSEQPRILSACKRPTETISCSRVNSGEALETCLLLRFAPGVHLPSKEDLMATFFRFGPLKASETKLLKDTGSAQVVFVRSADARESFRSLEQNKPFGAALVDYKLQHLSTACPPEDHFMTPTQPTRSTPMPGVAHPPLHIIKQNLEMMASMLENSGNNLSPEMRAKLDSELKSLLKKVNSRSGSSLQKSER